MLSEQEQELVTKYKSMTDDEKTSYLKENKIIILDYTTNEDGSANLVTEISDDIETKLLEVKNQYNLDTLDAAMTMVLSESIKKHANKED